MSKVNLLELIGEEKPYLKTNFELWSIADTYPLVEDHASVWVTNLQC